MVLAKLVLHLSNRSTVSLTDRTKILERWKEHFETVLNQSSSFDMNVLSEIPQWPPASRLDEVPTRAEIQTAINQMSMERLPALMVSRQKSLKSAARAFYHIWSACLKLYGTKQPFRETLKMPP